MDHLAPYTCFEGSVHVGDMGEMTLGLVIFLAFDETLFKGVASYIPKAVALEDKLKTSKWNDCMSSV